MSRPPHPIPGRGNAVCPLAIQLPLPLAVHHAWCLDGAGRVVEPTWRFSEECPAASALYMGIAFPARMVARSLIGRRYAGVINNFERKHPLLHRPLAESLAEWREASAA